MAWAILREDLSFKAMQSFMSERRSDVSWRQILSNHITQSCGPRRRGPILSLKACGFDSVTFKSGFYQLNIDFPHAFDENDEHSFSYSSGFYTNKGQVKNCAAREITVAMVVAAPRSFRMVPSCFKEYADIEQIRTFAERIHIEHLKNWENALGDMWVKRDAPILLRAAVRANKFSHQFQKPKLKNGQLPEVRSNAVEIGDNSLLVHNIDEVVQCFRSRMSVASNFPSPIAYSVPKKSDNPVNVNENDWNHRLGKRTAAVEAVYKSVGYKIFVQIKDEPSNHRVRPISPNPHDRTLSKRHWEYAIQCWRNAIATFVRDSYQNGCLVVAMNRLGFPVPLRRNGPFRLSPDGESMLEPFGYGIALYMKKLFENGLYIHHFDNHIIGVRVENNVAIVYDDLCATTAVECLELHDWNGSFYRLLPLELLVRND